MAWQTMFNSKAFSPTTTLTQEIGSSDTRIYVADVSVFPAVPTLATIGIASDLSEVVKITAIGNNFIDVERGYVGTAKSFTANAPISRNFSSKDQDIIQANLQHLKDNALFEVKAENIPANSISNDKLAQIATNTIKGRKSANQGDVEDLSASDVRTMLDVNKGADVTNTVLEAAGDTTIADNDKIVLVDVSVSSGSKIRTTLWSAIKTALNNLFVPKTRTVNNKALSEDISLTATDVGADATGTATTAVSNHNSDISAHSTLLETKQDKIDVTGILKRNAAGDIVQAEASVDYATIDDTKVFVVNFTESILGAITADKSISEIITAATAKKVVIGAITDNYYMPIAINEHGIVFGQLGTGTLETFRYLPDEQQWVQESEHLALSSQVLDELPSSGVPLGANTMYNVSDLVTNYTFIAPLYGEWAHVMMQTGGTVSISFSMDGGEPAPMFPDGNAPALEANSAYEIDVWNSTWYVQKVATSSGLLD